MKNIHSIIGDVHDTRFHGRTQDILLLDAETASKRRQRQITASGAEIAIDLPYGSYLRHGAVLDDDGESILVVERKPQPAMIVRILTQNHAELVYIAAKLGHFFGNQHVPIEAEGSTICIPVATTPTLMKASLERLGLASIEIVFDTRRLALRHALAAGHAH